MEQTGLIGFDQAFGRGRGLMQPDKPSAEAFRRLLNDGEGGNKRVAAMGRLIENGHYKQADLKKLCEEFAAKPSTSVKGTGLVESIIQRFSVDPVGMHALSVALVGRHHAYPSQFDEMWANGLLQETLGFEDALAAAFHLPNAPKMVQALATLWQQGDDAQKADLFVVLVSASPYHIHAMAPLLRAWSAYGAGETNLQAEVKELSRRLRENPQRWEESDIESLTSIGARIIHQDPAYLNEVVQIIESVGNKTDFDGYEPLFDEIIAQIPYLTTDAPIKRLISMMWVYKRSPQGKKFMQRFLTALADNYSLLHQRFTPEQIPGFRPAMREWLLAASRENKMTAVQKVKNVYLAMAKTAEDEARITYPKVVEDIFGELVPFDIELVARHAEEAYERACATSTKDNIRGEEMSMNRMSCMVLARQLSPIAKRRGKSMVKELLPVMAHRYPDFYKQMSEEDWYDVLIMGLVYHNDERETHFDRMKSEQKLRKLMQVSTS